VIRSSVLALLLLASGPALPQAWHGPYEPEKDRAPQPKPQPATPQAAKPAPRMPDRFPRDTPNVWLARMIHYKFINPEYAAMLAKRGIPDSSAHLAEEQWIRKARDEIARTRRSPDGVRVLAVPRAKLAPSLDGRIYAEEWAGALKIALDPAGNGGQVLLLALGGQLYLAAYAPTDRTEDGFDQFRFWFHIDLSPYLRNERVFLAGKGWFAQLREVRLPAERDPFQEAPPPERLTQKTDWNIFARTRGASRVDGYRQYEVSVDMAEAGFFPGVPFPAFFEIEGDPVKDEAGKFKSRTLLGTAGSQSRPLWLHILP
jgi:hypothetical protein